MESNYIATDQLTKELLMQLLERAAEFEKNGYDSTILHGKIIGSMFFEGSTRTRLSFETAAKRLGADVIGFADSADTSYGKKGESLEDTVRMVDAYADLLVLRHPDTGAAARSVSVATAPLINAGDGANDHPTQTLLDMFAIKKTQGRLDDISVAIVGDLKYARVARSLAKALSLFPSIHQYWVSPQELQMEQDVRDAVHAKKIEVIETESFEDAIANADIVYMTRVQAERFDNTDEYEKVKDVYVLTPDMLAHAKENMRILHALPRRYELPEVIDDTPYAYYFEQAAGGVAVRAALLEHLLS